MFSKEGNELGFMKWIQLQNNIILKKHSSSRSKPVQASLKKKVGYVHTKLLDKRRERESKYQLGDLVRIADQKNLFFLKMIQQSGLKTCTQSRKISMSQYHLIL